ncbi:hypothetical protein ENUP19_0121G0204 [Entamoeba nuttalli]|uniref:Uncharacterized protein n=2 Tax=Entamoeba nuttalli TaxID=412467 RepID=K2H524_ENTNP|nr:hypothetical protein ENU1_054110 [Entamoeba nuttalli P19]EKE41497.1 hypothetical protein ENU1_054110 [Entamoeba nuttalli P19]|eukprot:XP_008856169.1 hypothetical protein ENU1_054110 [Entamoeba nuttalli P19]
MNKQMAIAFNKLVEKKKENVPTIVLNPKTLPTVLDLVDSVEYDCFISSILQSLITETIICLPRNKKVLVKFN